MQVVAMLQLWMLPLMGKYFCAFASGELAPGTPLISCSSVILPLRDRLCGYEASAGFW